MPTRAAGSVSRHVFVLRTYRWTGKFGTVNARDAFGRTLPTTITSARPCASDDLALVPQLGAAGGQVGAVIDVHNISTTTCELAGAPRVTMTDNSGVVWRSSGPRDANPAQDKPVVLLANSWATLSPLWIGSSCDGFGLSTRLRLTIATGSSTTIAWRVGSRAPGACLKPGQRDRRVPTPGQMGRPSFSALPQGRETERDALTANERVITLRTPVSVSRGSLLKYTVRVSSRDDTGAPVWDPTCPLFQQTFDRTGPTYELDCQPSQIFLDNADDAVDFAMQVPVPPDAPLGATTLAWRLLEPEQGTITTTVTITN